MFNKLKELSRASTLVGYGCKNIGQVLRYGKALKINLLIRKDTILRSSNDHDKLEFQKINDFNLYIKLPDVNSNLRDICKSVDAVITYEDVFNTGPQMYTAKNLHWGSRILLRLFGRRILFATEPLVKIPASMDKIGFTLYLVKLSGWFKSSYVFYCVTHIKSSRSTSFRPSWMGFDRKCLEELKEVLEGYLEKLGL